MSHVSIGVSQHARLLEAERVLHKLIAAVITHQNNATYVLSEQVEVLLNEALIDTCEDCHNLFITVCAHCDHTTGPDHDREFDLINDERKP